MSTKERILTIRILEKLSTAPGLAKELGVEVKTEQAALWEKSCADGAARLKDIV